MEKQGDNRRSVARVFAGKSKLLATCFGKTSECYVDVSKVPFRGSSKVLLKDYKGNFLSIIQLLAKHDTVLDKLLQLPKGFPKYVGPLIQNELISVLAEEVLRDIKSELQNAPFFAVFLDTTQDVSKKDQLSEIFRYAKIDCHDNGKPSELKVVKAFTSFIGVEDSSAIELHKLITNSIQQKGLNIQNCRGQGYDGAAGMSGKYFGLHNKIQMRVHMLTTYIVLRTI